MKHPISYAIKKEINPNYDYENSTLDCFSSTLLVGPGPAFLDDRRDQTKEEVEKELHATL